MAALAAAADAQPVAALAALAAADAQPVAALGTSRVREAFAPHATTGLVAGDRVFVMKSKGKSGQRPFAAAHVGDPPCAPDGEDDDRVRVVYGDGSSYLVRPANLVRVHRGGAPATLFCNETREYRLAGDGAAKKRGGATSTEQLTESEGVAVLSDCLSHPGGQDAGLRRRPRPRDRLRPRRDDRLFGPARRGRGPSRRQGQGPPSIMAGRFQSGTSTHFRDPYRNRFG